MDVAELAVAAALALVPAVLRHRFADGLLVGQARRMDVELEAVFALQPFNRDLEMNFALPRQHHLMGVGMMFQRTCAKPEMYLPWDDDDILVVV